MIKSRFNHLLLLACIITAISGPAHATKEVPFAPQIEVDQQRLRLNGEYLLEYLWVDVYRAALYLPASTTPQADDVLSPALSKRLELAYLYALKRDDLIEAAWQTLRRQHSQTLLKRLQSDIDQLHEAFTAIKPGDHYSLDYNANNQTLTLRFNQQVVFSRANAELAQVYLGIWLGPEGLSDALRAALIGKP
ncbi:chalcone isomerase family protein [Atopomonas sediminilitoris]|uniref:chalcone isomerase family protein n=1 Tax=Atopomonas sediminilitoris TaxID=2919919 RepID=UPI001F4DCE77|nr:chalcone isomerase family protein [Atopomonas sediminilitoris]MCJ8167720.1 chalcone isomerase family protein [Atopomonas sediminilitoris]